MYAITFDLDTNCLDKQYPQKNYNNAYNDVKNFLISQGFTWTQGSVYFGDDSITAVHCVNTIQKLVIKFNWFGYCAKDVRMLRIEENNDLMPSINTALELISSSNS